MRALLDVNVLIALLDPDHVFHDRAHDWWAGNLADGWASCPLTENGVVRIMSNPGYSSALRFTPGDLIHRLQVFASQSDHEFWPDEITLRDGLLFVADHIHSSRQLTDIYLLGVASKHGGRLVTFDQGISRSTVRISKEENLCVL
jgi:toxin-antitoxin system PIN domain toxin